MAQQKLKSHSTGLPQKPNFSPHTTTVRGRDGESCAVAYLISQGYTVLTRNMRTRFGEIDIVAQKEGHTHLIEVKQRSSHVYGTPEEALTRLKRMKLTSMAMWYVSRYEEDVCIDLITIDGKQVSSHLQNIEFA